VRNQGKRHHARGAALLLVLIAVAMCTIMALSFLAAQGPTSAVASNIDRKTTARAIAESALNMAIDYVSENSDWRDVKSSGTWMTGVDLHGGTFDLLGTDDDGDLGNDPSDELILTAVGEFEGVTHRVMARIVPPSAPFAMEAGTVQVDGTAVQVTLQGSYTRPVVVCTPQIANNSEPLVVRVDAVTGGSFEVWLQRCDGGAVQAETVHYMVMEEGVYNVDGVLCEARRFESTQTDYKNNWRGQSRDFGNSYTSPVIFGQVITARDPRWSFFWCRGGSSSSPPTSGAFHVGKAVAEDPDLDRVDETLGYIVFESGRHTINGVEIDVKLSSDNVMGVTNGSGSNASYHHSFSNTPEVVVATQAGMDGGDGAWAMLWGASGITTTRARVIVDEDTLRDVERSHTTEQVGVIAFERPPDASSQQVVVQYEFDQAEITPHAVGHWRLDEPAGGGGGVAATDRVTLNNYALIDSYDSSRGAYGPSNTAESASVSTNTTGTDKIKLNSHTRVEGNAYIGPGGNPNTGINVYSFSYLTGQKLEAQSTAGMPSLSPPSGFPPSLGNITFSSGTFVISTDLEFTDLTLSGNVLVRIQGDVHIHVNDDFRMTNDSRVVLDPGARLTLWLDDNAELRDRAQLNADTTATDRVTVYVYGNNKRLRMQNDSVLAGSVFAKGDFRMENDAVFYGRVLAGDDVELYHNIKLHTDIALPSLGIATTPAVDEVIANDGIYRGDAIGGGIKPTALTASGTAAVFDGSGDFIQIPHSDTYLVDDGTVGFWFNADNTSGTQGLFSKDASGFGEGGHLSVYLSGGTLTASLSSASQEHTLSSSAVTAGQWHHVALAFGAEGLALYLDGVLVDSADYGGGLNATSGGLGNREPIVIGASASGASSGSASPLTNYFDGRIDDVRLHDQWCSASQVGEVMVGVDPTTRLSDTLVRDTGNYGTPLHLRIDNPANVTWDTGTLRFDNPTVARSLMDPGKLRTVMADSGAFTLAARFQRADPLTTSTPSVIMAVADSSSNANLLLGQESEQYEGRVRTASTGFSGALSPDFLGSGALDSDDSVHLVMTYDGTTLRTFVDGKLHKSQVLTGGMTNWSSAMPVAVGGIGSSGNWLGTIDSLRLYNEALNGTQVQNLASGLPVNSVDGSGSVVWDELD
jgi:hypothetical protein